MPTVIDRATLQSLFDNPTSSDLLIEAGAQCVRTFRVHKYILSAAIQSIEDRCTLPNGTMIPGQTRIRIPENPDVVETMLRHVYDFQDPRLQVKNIRDIDFGKRSLWHDFSFFMDLRKTSRKYDLEVLDDITALLIGACIQHERVDDNELILRMCRIVFEDNHPSNGELNALVAKEAHIRRRTSGTLVYSSDGAMGTVVGRCKDTNVRIRFDDKWRAERIWIEKRLRAAGLDWVYEAAAAFDDL
ncbi:hypothetical protein PRZ48_010867 [Zasmidium cellare]|uniref:BTB domain-containing protein n=1 Tax=Zasmidium cellare TaxID=395010 RepID=A0ABR0EAQ0_ZASCE|nr:hypothetical protein PRZ48_010867 [Zasmidium cellare]